MLNQWVNDLCHALQSSEGLGVRAHTAETPFLVKLFRFCGQPKREYRDEAAPLFAKTSTFTVENLLDRLERKSEELPIVLRLSRVHESLLADLEHICFSGSAGVDDRAN